jgi:hypothetical protein
MLVFCAEIGPFGELSSVGEHYPSFQSKQSPETGIAGCEIYSTYNLSIPEWQYWRVLLHCNLSWNFGQGLNVNAMA